MILLAIEAKEERKRRAEEDREQAGVPRPHSYGSEPPLSPDELAALPSEKPEGMI